MNSLFFSDCVDMRSLGGDYYYTSQGQREVCGLYLIGDPDTLVEVEISLDIQCDLSNIVAVIDGWELHGEYFPSPLDHSKSLDDRYIDLCHDNKPHKKYLSSQNVALIQFLIPSEGQGFRVRINFVRNPAPCNAIAMGKSGEITLKNYGKKSNCSVSIIYPEKIYLVNVDIGVSSEGGNIKTKSGLSCTSSEGRSDYVEFLFGDGLDTDLMSRKLAFCAKHGMVMGCQHSVVRLVSSGDYYNSITFAFQPPSNEDLQKNLDICS
ncbi:hypothetical protein LOTGIDRAFT_131128 [Lottia gigantea]|uniref:Corticotropin-releasing factor-binding protein n=1 Tax=Lottia gigantea TaxID=225164 RepID=V3Z389_LOTGI|nr:hypothetical protein LOTGIDRAFT_131128 [Lottia gigantea]ESO85083.1 hypothetical protein LOTGIDRAFT_131128 [Lottia gigantea]